MALTIIATPSASNANSYCTLAEAEAFHETNLYATAWTDATDDEKTAALIWATRILDEQVQWYGYQSTVAQSLAWPRSAVQERSGMAYIVPTIVPAFLKNATAELAKHLLTGDRTKERGFGIKSVVADTVSVEFDKHDVKPFLPPSVISMVSMFGDISGPGRISVPLVRV